MADASDVLNMSDEDFLKTPPAVEVKVPVEKVDAAVAAPLTETAEPVVVVKELVQPSKGTKEAEENKDEDDKDDDEVIESIVKVTPKPKPKAKPVAGTKDDPTADESEDTEGDEEGEVTEVEKPTADAPDYKALYEKVMLPFKANGRTIELRTPEEAVQLMQMGANYTKKMQELVPHKKVLTMLQNNGLMDEGKLSYLIDLDKKNPEAIKKLIKEAGLDPTEIDTSVEPAYREGNHRVSDDEVTFSSALEDMKSTPDRVKTLQVINENWDRASIEALYKSPDIMSVIHGQRETGVYDRIATEVHRRQTLGQIPTSTPFLQAYKVVGDQMTAADAFKDLLPAHTPLAKTAPVVVATRVAAVKSALTNNDRAAAASTTRQAPASSTKVTKNPFAMSDEDFLKQMNGRV